MHSPMGSNLLCVVIESGGRRADKTVAHAPQQMRKKTKLKKRGTFEMRINKIQKKCPRNV